MTEKTMNKKFEVKIDKSADCWQWTAYTDKAGYGTFNTGEKMVKAHRYSYEQNVGQIPDGLVIDHLCRNRSCVNPEHLEAVTQAENVRRGDTGKHNRAKSHCSRGHEYTAENTRLYGNRRHCVTCIQIRHDNRRVTA